MHLRKCQFLVSQSELHLLLSAQGPTEVSPVLMTSHTHNGTAPASGIQVNTIKK